MMYQPFVVDRPKRIRVRDRNLEIDIPGPFTLQWSRATAEERIGHVKEEAIPIGVGIAFAAAPYVAGAAIVAFAPPWVKPVGVAMIVPNPVADAFYFSVGYGVGQEIQQYI